MDYAEDSARAIGYALRGKELGDPTGMASAVLAGIYISLGDYKTAGTYADEAVKANPNLAYAYYVRGQIAQYSGAPKEAIQWYKQALQASNNDKKQWGGYIVVALAGLYSAQDQEDQATKLLTDAITRDRDYPGLMYQLANIYFKKRQLYKGDGDQPELYRPQRELCAVLWRRDQKRSTTMGCGRRRRNRHSAQLRSVRRRRVCITMVALRSIS